MSNVFNWFKRKSEYKKLSVCDKKLIKDKYKIIHELETEIKILKREIEDIKAGY